MATTQEYSNVSHVSPEKNLDVNNGEKEKKNGIRASKIFGKLGGFASAPIMKVGVVVVVIGAIFIYSRYYKSHHNKNETEDNTGEKPSRRSGRRVHFDGDHEEEDDEDEMEAEERARMEQQQMVSHIKAMSAYLSTMQKEIQHNDKEIAENKQKLATLFGSNNSAAAAGDDEMSRFEDEQSLDTAFIMKDDLDKQRAGVAKLDEELGLNKGHLIKKYNHQIDLIKQATAVYHQRYGPLIQQN
jgi:hypothetical protein